MWRDNCFFRPEIRLSEFGWLEPFQILKYQPGQFYKVHHDQNSGHFTPQV